MKIKPKQLLKLIILVVFLFLFFSYRLSQTPNGINIDEASYGYNGVLLAQNLHDSHGRFMPIFILGFDNITWYPPYVQYMVALFFKLLGPSIFAMRLVTVFISTISALLIMYFAKILFDKKSSLIALISFLIIPELMIETHTVLEHMIVVPFVLLWLIGLFGYSKNFNKKYIILSALSLGIGFYSYAGIRPLVVVWGLTTLAYLVYLKPRPKKFLPPLLTFCLTGLPFVAIIPVLEHYYSGAIFNHASLNFDSIYNFFYFYISSFDLSFLFVTGDKLLIQSTLRHGMFLLSTLPVFAVGIYQTFKSKSDFLKLLGIIFFMSPILFGFLGSVYFAHRLTYMIPFYVIFMTLGVTTSLKAKNKLIKYASYFLFVLIAINYFDFWKYYMFDYPKDTYQIFYHLEDYTKPYKHLSESAQKYKLKPYISFEYTNTHVSETELFARSIYLPKINVLEDEYLLPENGILLSKSDNIKGLKKLDIKSVNLFIVSKTD